MADFALKRNDTSPALKYQLQNEAGDAVDISGFNEVKFFMREEGKDTNKVDDDTAGDVSVIDSTNGKVKYAWNSTDGDTDTEARYEAEFEVEYSDGEIETFPNGRNYIVILIGDDLG